MHSREFSIEDVDPAELFGANEVNWRIVRAHFPELNLVARGDRIVAKGSREDLGRWEEVMRMLVWHVGRYHRLGEDDVHRLLRAEEAEVMRTAGHEDTLVHGPGGVRIAARTPNQRKLVDAIRSHDLVFALGPAGTGKTYTAVAMAVAALKDKRIKKIVLTRPAV